MNGAHAQAFAAFVDGLAAQLAAISPTFESFVAAMPGVLPDEALASLHRISDDQARRLIADAANDRAGPLVDQCAALPLPHPLDSEFRFDATTAAILARSLVDATRAGDEILLIGVPSVAVELATMNVDRVIRFLGPDNCVTRAVRSAFEGQRLEIEQGTGHTAAAALLDPPWYEEPMSDLIAICAHGLKGDAIMQLVLPPIGTRPEIARDRSTFLAAAATAGFRQTGTSGPVCYRTPLFELAAMERQGIARLRSWRRGEAVEFLMGEAGLARTWSQPRADELSFRGVRLRLVPGDKIGGATLIPIDGHEVFPSVSARAPGRSKAALWTTTNRAFSVDFDLAFAALTKLAGRPDLLHLGIYGTENDHSTDQGVEPSTQLIHQLAKLIGRELDDARRLVGDGAWLKTDLDWRCSRRPHQ